MSTKKRRESSGKKNKQTKTNKKQTNKKNIVLSQSRPQSSSTLESDAQALESRMVLSMTIAREQCIVHTIYAKKVMIAFFE